MSTVLCDTSMYIYLLYIHCETKLYYIYRILLFFLLRCTSVEEKPERERKNGKRDERFSSCVGNQSGRIAARLHGVVFNLLNGCT